MKARACTSAVARFAFLAAAAIFPASGWTQDAPADARGPDYSDGIDHNHMPGMEMLDDAAIGTLLIDQLEFIHGDGGTGQRWEMQGWYGNDVDKLWLRSEGERRGGRIDDADLEAFWSRAFAAYWDTQLGVRHDYGTGSARDWAAFGIEGLAPYFFETQAAIYVGSSGRTAARLRADYDVLFTQRLILQPELEVNFYGRADPRREIGSGLSDARLGLRLRYEIRRQFAPYVGVSWTRRFGDSAGLAQATGAAILDRQWVAGVRVWF